MTPVLQIFPDTDALVSRALELFRTVLPSLDACDGVMLSGGRTPLELYRRAAAEHLPVRGVLFLSDERQVPGDDPRSNYGAIAPFFGSLLKVRTELPLADAAQAFHDDLSRIATIPLGLLGLGADGHTASLFTLDDAARRDSRLAIPVVKTDKPDRISVTPALLGRIGKIIILAPGAEKNAVLRRLIDQPRTIPAGIALAGHTCVEIWTDQDV